MEFTFKRQDIIVPSPPSPPHVVTLSTLDQIMPPLYTSVLYFFPPPSTPPPSESLTHSLARALLAFPPLAGRFKPRTNGAGMDVECHNQGAVFVEAHAPVTLDDLLFTGNGDVRSRMYEPSPVWSSLVPNPDEEEYADKPPLFIQLTRLACGGLVVGMLLHHLVVDGTARMHFTASWAELARGQPITAHPHLDRTCMEARASPCPSFQHNEYIIHKTARSKLLDAVASREQLLPPTTSRIFEFLPQDIQALKERANADVGGDGCTGFQALAAHIWKHVTKARGLEASQLIKLGWPVNGRDRFNPPLPPNYLGNAIFCACTEARAGDVGAQPVGQTAAHIRSATRAITDEYMRSALAVMAAPALVSFGFRSPVDLVITSWVPFKAYEMDWGWGPPLYFTRLISKPPTVIRGGKVVLLPHANSHAVNALVVLFQPNMDALLLDTQFHPILL